MFWSLPGPADHCLLEWRNNVQVDAWRNHIVCNCMWWLDLELLEKSYSILCCIQQLLIPLKLLKGSACLVRCYIIEVRSVLISVFSSVCYLLSPHYLPWLARSPQIHDNWVRILGHAETKWDCLLSRCNQCSSKRVLASRALTLPRDRSFRALNSTLEGNNCRWCVLHLLKTAGE